MQYFVDTGASNPKHYHLSISDQRDKWYAVFPTHLSPLFVPTLLLLFILKQS